jgi:hypothetical protein
MYKIVFKMMHGTKLLAYLSLIILLTVSCNEYESFRSFDRTEGYWKEISSVVEGLTKVYFIDPKIGWAVGENGKITFTHDGGKIWFLLNSGTSNRLYSILFTDTKKGFVAGMNNTMLFTDNAGIVWSPINIPSDVSTMFNSICRDNLNNLWFITNYGEVFCSTNSGQDWISKTKFNEWGYSYLFFQNSRYGFAMRSAGKELKKTIDGGLSWSTYTIPTQCDWVGDVFFLDDKYGWYSEEWGPSSSFVDSVSLYQTTNGGETWRHKAKLPGLSIEKIHFIDPYNGWLANGTRILHTTDCGKTWEPQFETKDGGHITDIFFADASNGWALTSTNSIIKYSTK